MSKLEFIEKLEEKLTILKVKDKSDIVSYYEELISDQIELGKDEKEVIKKLGNISDIVLQALVNNTESSQNDVTMKKVVKKIKDTSGAMPRWLFYTLVATAIIWVPVAFGLLITLFSVGIGLTAVVFSLILVILIVPTSVILVLTLLGALIILFSILHLIIWANLELGIFYLGMGIAAIGLAIIMYPITRNFIKWTLATFKKMTKRLYVKYRVYKAKKEVSIDEN